MTWLAPPDGAIRSGSSVLRLSPEPYAVLRKVLALAATMTDARLLWLCRLRLAQLMETRRGPTATASLLSNLESWHDSSEFNAAERAALSFAEQYHYDHLRLSDEHREPLREHLPGGGLASFTWALHTHDAYLRVSTLLDLVADEDAADAEMCAPSERGRVAAPAEVGVAEVSARVGGDFAVALDELNRTTVRQSLLDPLTSELVRLKNAAHQRCRY
jgi:hypothetical protein